MANLGQLRQEIAARGFREVGIFIEAGRVFEALRKNGPAPLQDRPAVYHAVTPNCRMALCATEPGAASGWAPAGSDQVTCRICQRRLAALRARSGHRSTRAG